MRKVLALLAFGLAACGGGPALQHAPRPDPTAVAGLAAAAAVAATLADPNLNRTPEKKAADKSDRPKASHATVPSDVLDRLDDQPAVEAEAAAPEVTAEDVADAPPLPAIVLPAGD